MEPVLQLLIGTDVTLVHSQAAAKHPCSAMVPCLCLSSSDSHTEHCCQGYHLLILVHNFEPHHQATARPMAGTKSPDTHAQEHMHPNTEMTLCPADIDYE